jgi:hypothetical protein
VIEGEFMYFHFVSQVVRNLHAVEVWLDKAESFAASKKFDVNVLMTSRLAPDMKPFIYQVQSACDYVKAAAAWLSQQKPPKHEDNESTIDDVRGRVRKTVAFAEGVRSEEYERAGEQQVHMSWGPAGKVLGGRDYLVQMSIPNVYFHLAMAYAILRSNGVDVGKMDFLGGANWVDAI